jgi:two-component system, chemotaxis family, CheB/CheR fusion protein
MNEELQSTNLELETINVELSVRTAELDELSAYLSSILRSVRMGVVVLDRNMDIRVWNHQTEDLWGLRADEVVGKGFPTLDIGLPVEKLEAPIRACIDEGVEHHESLLDAVNRRGRPVRCRVTCAPLMTASNEVRGAVLLIEEWNERPDGGGAGDPPRVSRDGEELAPSG